MEPESKIESIKIQGFRSLADVELTDLPNAAVLIGPNGSGKSNVFRFLEMVRQMLRYRRLGEFVARHGGADDQLFGGSGQTSRIYGGAIVKTNSANYQYQFALSPSVDDTLAFGGECVSLIPKGSQTASTREVPNNGFESVIQTMLQEDDRYYDPVQEMVSFLGGLGIYQFHDTGDNSNFKKRWDLEDNNRLLPHGGNLAAVLHRLERIDVRRYDYLCRQIERVVPNFDRFAIEESYGRVPLRWKAKGSDKTIGAHLTSDGSLRFFALVTLLNLPPEMLPRVILLDEPELGLHPAAIGLVGAMIKRMSRHRQVIVATQSPLMLNEFDLGEVYVFDLKDGQTRVHRPDEEGLKNWVEKYSTGEIWLTNLIGGRPWSVWP